MPFQMYCNKTSCTTSSMSALERPAREPAPDQWTRRSRSGAQTLPFRVAGVAARIKRPNRRHALARRLLKCHSFNSSILLHAGTTITQF
jgi:hypothetical protein